MYYGERREERGGEKRIGGGEPPFIRIKGNAVTTIVRLVLFVYSGLSLSFRLAISVCTHIYMIHLDASCTLDTDIAVVWFRKRYLARDIGRMNDAIPGILGLTISIRYFIVCFRALYAALAR